MRTVKPPTLPLSRDGALERWNNLAEGLVCIHAACTSQVSGEWLYRQAYTLVIHGHAEFLYDRLMKYETTWLRTRLSNSLEPLAAKVIAVIDVPLSDISSPALPDRKARSEDFLTHFRDLWADYCLSSSMISDVCMALDYRAEDRHLRDDVFTSLSSVFRNSIFETKISDRESYDTPYKIVESVISDQVLTNRLGATVDYNLIRSCIFAMENINNAKGHGGMHLFETRTARALLDESRKFYSAEAASIFGTYSPLAFCKAVRKRLLEEELRSAVILPRYMELEMKAIVEDVMLRPYISDVVALDGPGMTALLDKGPFRGLAIIYETIARVDANKTALAVALGNWLTAALSEISTESSKSPKTPLPGYAWVTGVMRIQQRAEELLERAFHLDPRMRARIESALSDYCQESPPSKFLAVFLDEHLKGTTPSHDQLPVDAILERALQLLTLIHNHDGFQEHYLVMLSNRRSAMPAADSARENAILNKLRPCIASDFLLKAQELIGKASVEASDEAKVERSM